MLPARRRHRQQEGAKVMRAITVVVAVLMVGATAEVQAGTVIPTRSALNAALGAGGTTEDFEKFSISSNAITTPVTMLASGTIVNGQGPGLVVGSLAFDMGGGTL